MTKHRLASISELLRAELSRLIIEEMRDPRLGFITVTGVEVSPDLSHAKVFVSVLGDENGQSESLKVLSRAASFFRTRISRTLNLKRTPDFKFILDRTEELGARIDQILDGPDNTES